MKYYIIPDRLNIDESLKLSREYNLGFEFDDFWHPDILSDSKKLDETVRFYGQYDLPSDKSLHGDFFDVIIFSVDRSIAEISEERIWQSMAAAEKMNIKRVVFHSNINSFLAKGYYLDNWITKNENFFRLVCSKYPHIEVLMENMFDAQPGPLATLARRMEDVSNFNICFDYAHAFISQTPVEEWVRELSTYIKHVHINDNDGKEDLHLPLGKGIIDFDKFFELQERYFPTASVLIEISGIDNQIESLKYLSEKKAFQNRQ